MKNQPLKKIEKYENIILYFIVAIVTAIYVYKIGQDANFDLLNYHYFTGYSYLSERTGDIAPANIQTFTHPAMNILTYIAFSKLTFPHSAWLILFFQLLSVPALLKIANEINLNITGNRFGLEKNIALLLCFISPLWLSELGTSFFSSTTSPLILWSLYFIIRKNKKVALEGVIAGILMGLSLGLKLTNAPFVIGSVFAVFIKSLIDKNAKITFIMAFGLGGILGVGLTSNWYWELWLNWGNPLFPFYNKIFKSPYFDPINWRDNRWVFNGVVDYIKFTLDAVSGTVKTSEVSFKDSRIILISFAPLLLTFKIKKLIKNNTIILITYFYVSYVLWAFLFAYQRYAIPLEIMYGIIVWITLNTLFSKRRVNVIILMVVTLTSLSHFKIPNWGHIKPSENAQNPFSLRFPKNFDNIPALYLVDGVTISHVLTHLNPESIFVGLRFSEPVNELIKKEIYESSKLPLRILTTEGEIKNLNSLQSKFGFSDQLLDCSKITSSVGNYVVCSVVPKTNNAMNKQNVLSIDYVNKKSREDENINVFTEGLGDYEKDGRWSVGNKVRWNFINCITLVGQNLIIKGNAFGPNVGKIFNMQIGENKYNITFKSVSSDVVTHITNPTGQCINSVELDIPSPSSPNELGESTDARKLGLQVQSVTIK